MVQATLQGLLVLFDSIIPVEDFDLFLQSVKFVLNLQQDLLQLLFLALCIIDGLHHASDFLIKECRPSHLGQHLEETSFSLLNQLLHLALCHDLKLRLARERKVATFKQIEQILLGDWSTIEVVIFLVGVAIVLLSKPDFFCLNWDSVLWVVQGDLNPVSVCVETLVLGCSRACGSCVALWPTLLPLLAGACLLRNIIQKTSFLMLGHARELVAEHIYNRVQEGRFTASILSKHQIAPRTEPKIGRASRALHFKILIRQEVFDGNSLDKECTLISCLLSSIIGCLHVLPLCCCIFNILWGLLIPIAKSCILAHWHLLFDLHMCDLFYLFLLIFRLLLLLI